MAGSQGRFRSAAPQGSLRENRPGNLVRSDAARVFPLRDAFARALHIPRLHPAGGTGANTPCRAGEPEELLDLCKLDALPQDIRGSLSRNFSGWKILEPTDLTARARTRWGSERPLTCPGIATGHFQDAKSASYALLLIPADHSTTAYRLLVFTQQSGQQFYGFKALGQADSGASDVYVKACRRSGSSKPPRNGGPLARERGSHAGRFGRDPGVSLHLLRHGYEREPVSYQ